jgi:hypothetical protein
VVVIRDVPKVWIDVNPLELLNLVVIAANLNRSKLPRVETSLVRIEQRELEIESTLSLDSC